MEQQPQNPNLTNISISRLSSPQSNPPFAVPLFHAHQQYMHRRSHSDSFVCRFPEEMNLFPNTCFDVRTPESFDKVAEGEEEDDLLDSYISLDIIEGAYEADDDGGPGIVICNSGGGEKVEKLKASMKLMRRSHSVGCLCTSPKDKENICETKKAMAPDKLAELWAIDPKRAKRILANRQSAARSKERKARYIVELEKKVQALQTEATALSVQFSLYERDTMGLTNENTELRRQLKSMEQQAQLRDALNEALEKELERLKFMTGEANTSSDAYIMGAQHMGQYMGQYKSSSYPQQQQIQSIGATTDHIDAQTKIPAAGFYLPFESNLSISPRHHFYSKGADSNMLNPLQPLDLSFKPNIQLMCPSDQGLLKFS